MSIHIALNQTKYSDAYYDNGTLIIKRQSGGDIIHIGVPQSIFYGFKTTGNTDKYYKDFIKNFYPNR